MYVHHLPPNVRFHRRSLGSSRSLWFGSSWLQKIRFRALSLTPLPLRLALRQHVACGTQKVTNPTGRINSDESVRELK